MGGIRLCHGSPRSDIELLTPETSVERIQEATAGISERVLVHGHTHLQYDRAEGEVRVIGPGSVGQPFTEGPFGARWAILASEVELVVTPYDIEDARRRTEATGYPSERFMTMLESPYRPAEIVADAESRLFSE